MTDMEPPAGCRETAGSAGMGITWYGPLEPRDRELNQSWCGTVAPPVVVVEPSAAYGAWGPGDTLVVATWNVFVGGGDLLAFLRDELAVECRIDASGPPLLRTGFAPFVLLLQETYRRVPALRPVEPGPLIPWIIQPDRPGVDLDIEGFARACGLSLIYVPSARNGPDAPGRIPEDKGNAIVSSLPLSDLIAIELPFEAGRKVAVGATLASRTGERLRVVSVHLDLASTLYRTLLTGNGTRLRQVAGLAEALESRPIPTLVGGDFNTWSTREATLQYMERHFPLVPPDGSGTRGEFPADHIFLDSLGGTGLELVPGTYRLTEDSYLSDHRPRMVRIGVGSR